MTALLLALFVAPAYRPADIDLSADPATLARHDGCRVRMTFKAARVFQWGEATTLQPAPGTDGVRRAAVVGKCEAAAGESVTVVGTLRVIRHPAHAFGRVRAPAFTEVLVRGERADRP